METELAGTVTVEPNERFRTRQEALDWLRSQGATISTGKFYQDGKGGKYRLYPDKSVSRSSVAEYLLKMRGAAPGPALELIDYSQKKQQLETEKLQLEVEKLRIATRASDREWMRTDDHWAHLAASLALAKGNLEHFARAAASEIIAGIGSDYHLAPQLADLVVELVINRAYNELAVQRIEHGRFAEEESDGE